MALSPRPVKFGGVGKGAGHTWPGSRLPLLYQLFLGRTSFEVDATAEIWRARERV